MTDPIYRLLKGIRNYGNPFSILYQRRRKSPIITVVDRKTGLKFRCRNGADDMLGETFHADIYNIPFVPLRDGDFVLDVGANHGFYACWAAHQGATVHAFEPDPNTFDLLAENIRLNGFENRVTAHRCAIGAEAGKTQMFCSDNLGGGMSTIIPAFAVKSGIHVIQQTTVDVLTLRDALDLVKSKRVRVCKLDCEGAEYSVLAGLQADVLEHFDAFALEYHSEAYKLADLLNVMLRWDDFHISKSISRDADLENANLSAVRRQMIEQWADPAAVAKRPSRSQIQNTVTQRLAVSRVK